MEIRQQIDQGSTDKKMRPENYCHCKVSSECGKEYIQRMPKITIQAQQRYCQDVFLSTTLTAQPWGGGAVVVSPSRDLGQRLNCLVMELKIFSWRICNDRMGKLSQ